MSGRSPQRYRMGDRLTTSRSGINPMNSYAGGSTSQSPSQAGMSTPIPSRRSSSQPTLNQDELLDATARRDSDYQLNMTKAEQAAFLCKYLHVLTPEFVAEHSESTPELGSRFKDFVLNVSQSMPYSYAVARELEGKTPDEIFEEWAEKAENLAEFSQVRKTWQALIAAGRTAEALKMKLACALYFTKDMMEKREWIGGMWWAGGPFNCGLPGDSGFLLGAIAARLTAEIRRLDPDLELYCMVFDFKMTGTGGGKGCDWLKGIPQQMQLVLGTIKSKVGATARWNYNRGLGREIRSQLAAAVPGSDNHALWQKCAGAEADVAVVQNSTNKRSLSQMEKTAAVNGSKNLGTLIKNRMGTPGNSTNLTGFMASGGHPFDDPVFVDAVMNALDQHIISSPARLFNVRGRFQVGAQDFDYPNYADNPEDPVVDMYISTGCLVSLGLAIYKFVLGHAGPGTLQVRFGQHNRSVQYSAFTQQAMHLPATSGSQWIFDRENDDFRFGRDLVHPEMYTELPAAALAHQAAALGVGAAPVAMAAADLMQQFV